MATIFISNLVIKATHGVHQHEKITPQRFNVSASLTADTTKAGKTDDLADTIDWSKLRQLVIDTVERNTFNLMERLVQEVATQIKKHDQRISEVTVRIEKLDAFVTGIPGIELTLK